MATHNDVIKTLMLMGEMFSKSLSEGAAQLYLEDLGIYPPDTVLAALKRCRRELGRFPATSDVISRIEDMDGRPGAEEAWALIPKDEESSIVWTEEMAEAFGSVRGLLLEGDSVAARMAFKETYTRLIEQAKAQGRPAKWSASFGHDKEGRIQALETAVHRGHLSVDAARALLPDFRSEPRDHLQITGPIEQTDDQKELLSNIKTLLGSMPGGKVPPKPAVYRELTQEETERLKREQIERLKKSEGLL